MFTLAGAAAEAPEGRVREYVCLGGLPLFPRSRLRSFDSKKNQGKDLLYVKRKT